MKKNKGFTIIEVLVVIAIIGILSSVIISAFKHAKKCEQNPKSCPQSMKDKTVPEQEAEPQFKYAPVSSYKPSEDDFGCDMIDSSEERKQCQDEEYRSKGIQECISRYTREE